MRKAHTLTFYRLSRADIQPMRVREQVALTHDQRQVAALVVVVALARDELWNAKCETP
jgi:hypothetical protein